MWHYFLGSLHRRAFFIFAQYQYHGDSLLYKYLVLFTLFSTQIFANTVYTWEDSEGTRHFSDYPPSETIPVTQLAISSIGTIEIPSVKPLTPKKITPEKVIPNSTENKQTRLVIAINNLEQEETIRSSRGHITVLTTLTRHLHMSEKLQLLLDGSPYGPAQTSTEWTLKNVNRGTHLITVIALKDGKRIASSPIITIYLHRPSVN